VCVYGAIVIAGRLRQSLVLELFAVAVDVDPLKCLNQLISSQPITVVDPMAGLVTCILVTAAPNSSTR